MKTAEEYEADVAALKEALASAQSRCEFLEGRRRQGVKEMLANIDALTNAVYRFFGYEEDWEVFPLSDETDKHWFVTEEEVVGSGDPMTVESVTSGWDIFGGIIYRRRSSAESVLKAGGYTMICVDTQTDGNKFLAVYDDAKLCADPAVIEAYEENWG